jgi:hypothetical protein
MRAMGIPNPMNPPSQDFIISCSVIGDGGPIQSQAEHSGIDLPRTTVRRYLHKRIGRKKSQGQYKSLYGYREKYQTTPSA